MRQGEGRAGIAQVVVQSVVVEAEADRYSDDTHSRDKIQDRRRD